MTKYLHTMIRVSSLEDSIAFFEVLGLRDYIDKNGFPGVLLGLIRSCSASSSP